VSFSVGATQRIYAFLPIIGGHYDGIERAARLTEQDPWFVVRGAWFVVGDLWPARYDNYECIDLPRDRCFANGDQVTYNPHSKIRRWHSSCDKPPRLADDAYMFHRVCGGNVGIFMYTISRSLPIFPVTILWEAIVLTRKIEISHD
jgi:hypothetical protein